MKPHPIAVITDSTCDIPAGLAQELGIQVVPLYLLFGDDHLRDGIDIDGERFYKRLTEDPAHPSTSQPTPADFVREIKASGAEEIVCVHVSNRLSGTIASATAARELVDIPVHVVDSMSVSLGLGHQAIAAARVRNAGGTVEDIIAATDKVQATLQVVFTVDTLEYLHRGGRIGSAAKVLGTAFQLKPVLVIPVESGQIDAVERVRSRKRSLARVVEYALEQLDAKLPLHVGVMNGVCPEEAQWVLNEFRSRANVVDEVFASVTPVVGTHGGPGVLGVAVYTD